ncbi:hypothetical protein QQ045_011746 [Rhodiola kirilowii]
MALSFYSHSNYLDGKFKSIIRRSAVRDLSRSITIRRCEVNYFLVSLASNVDYHGIVLIYLLSAVTGGLIMGFFLFVYAVVKI